MHTVTHSEEEEEKRNPIEEERTLPYNTGDNLYGAFLFVISYS